MDLFQPVTLIFKQDCEPKNAISFANLRLAVIAVMKEISPLDRESVQIRGREGQLDFSGIAQLYEALQTAQPKLYAQY